MARVSKAAYTLVDLSDLEPEVRAEIIEDAYAGGGEFGIKVVEETVSGSVRTPIFGFYDFEAHLWDEAKEAFGIKSNGASDEEEARIRAGAAQATEAEADTVREAEEAEIRRIAGDDEGDAVVKPNKAKR